MNIDKDQLLEMMLWAFGNLEKLESELLAHQVVFFTLKSTGEFPELDGLLEAARNNPSPKLAKQHQEIRSTIATILEQANADQALLRLLRDWKPTGPAN